MCVCEVILKKKNQIETRKKMIFNGDRIFYTHQRYSQEDRKNKRTKFSCLFIPKWGGRGYFRNKSFARIGV